MYECQECGKTLPATKYPEDLCDRCEDFEEEKLLMKLEECDMTLQTIHLNGTGHKDLLKQAEDVYRAAGELIEALSKATPNARDYYPQATDAAHTQAVAEHQAMLMAVSEIRNEMLAIADHIHKNERRPAPFQTSGLIPGSSQPD